MIEKKSWKGAQSQKSQSDEKTIEDNLRLRVPVVYEIVREEGREDLKRPLPSLWWSGVAAGLCISMSVVSEGLLERGLPASDWRPLVSNFGYCVGFLIVVLGRLQLFTENTITAVIPLLTKPSWHNLTLMARLWSVVFAANLVGTFLFAVAVEHSAIFSPEQTESFLEIFRHFMAKTPSEMLLHGIPAGFLIAAMVWMIPSAKGSEFWVIVMMTYLIALADLAHVVAGSTEAFMLLLAGETSLYQTFVGFMLPALLGNVIGGTLIFSLLVYGQVKDEMHERSRAP
tara:strand:- start:106 stop:960 length:855 start_codon:yes stop_codon:yes gene_type:complete